MNNILLVFIGSGCGGALRYWLSTTVDTVFGTMLPWGTLSVNMFGSFFIGFCATFIIGESTGQHNPFNYLLLIGFMGGFTTFSAFSLQTLQLLQKGAITHGIFNIILSITLCLITVYIGNILGKTVFSH